jgi:hypothetical protein
VLGYAITSIEKETYRPARVILLGDDATPELRRATSLDALVTQSSPRFFLWHTAEDVYVPPEHTYRLAASLAAHGAPHSVHVFAHGPHNLGLAEVAATRKCGRRWRRHGWPSRASADRPHRADGDSMTITPTRVEISCDMFAALGGPVA